jgi:hypothetical protein
LIAAGMRVPLYALLNVGFVVYLAIAAAFSSAANPRFVYVALLFAICSTPVLLVRQLNDRYSLYAMFLAIYFVSFGMLDFLTISTGKVYYSPDTSVLSAAEALILAGGAAFIVGYVSAASRRQSSTFAAEDWPKSSLVAVGLLLWAGGTVAAWYWSINLTVRSGEFNFRAGQSILTTLMLGRYAQPLGLLILAYAYTASRSTLMTIIVIAVASIQVVIGFISDTKGGAMSGGIMVIVTAFLVTGRIPKAWALAGLLFIFLAFPIFQAHRIIVVDERGQSNAQSAQNIVRALELSVQGQQRAATEHAESFFQRSSVKGSVEMIVRRTGDGVAYQRGFTLLPLLTIFIPRFIWPEKLDVQTGQLLDKEFNVTGLGEVYISPSSLGELYWNFGWIGAVSGMLLIGAIVGWINRKCDISQTRSVGRLLVLAITIYQLGVRFEGSIAGEYSVWLRSIVAILIMNRLFARGSAVRREVAARQTSRAPTREAAVRNAIDASSRFPNLLR